MVGCIRKGANIEIVTYNFRHIEEFPHSFSCGLYKIRVCITDQEVWLFICEAEGINEYAADVPPQIVGNTVKEYLLQCQQWRHLSCVLVQPAKPFCMLLLLSSPDNEANL